MRIVYGAAALTRAHDILRAERDEAAGQWGAWIAKEAETQAKLDEAKVECDRLNDLLTGVEWTA